MKKFFNFEKMTLSLILDKKGDLGERIELGKYNKTRTDALIEALEDGNPCEGFVLVSNMDTSEGTYIEGKYLYDGDSLSFEECEVKIIVKEKIKNRKKTFSQKEKLELLLDYIKNKKKMPVEDTVYKECQIGKFLNDASKWDEIYDVIKEAKDENT